MVEKPQVLKCQKSKYFCNVLKYKYTRFLRNLLKYNPSTLQIVLKYRCTQVQSTAARLCRPLPGWCRGRVDIGSSRSHAVAPRSVSAEGRWPSPPSSSSSSRTRSAPTTAASDTRHAADFTQYTQNDITFISAYRRKRVVGYENNERLANK